LANQWTARQWALAAAWGGLLIAGSVGSAGRASAQAETACNVTPLTAETMIYTIATAVATPASDQLTWGGTPIPLEVPSEADLPAGEPVDDATRAEVVAVVETFVACVNNGDFGQFAALFTPDALAMLYGGTVLTAGGDPMTAAELPSAIEDAAFFFATPIEPVEAPLLTLVEARDARRLSDGRVGIVAVMEESDEEVTRDTVFFLLAETDDGWRIDGGIEIVAPGED
jgi:hypothetical protein